MPSSSLTKFHDFVDQLGRGVHNFSSHTFKVALTNTAPTASTDDELADITQIAATGGYTAGAGGGYTLDSVSWSETGGVGKLTIADEVITATGGDVGPFRYLVIYNDTSTGDKLIGFYDYGSSITLFNGEFLNIDFDGSNGVLTIT
jgi:hypothetical protein